jgi:hypothetical protein
MKHPKAFKHGSAGRQQWPRFSLGLSQRGLRKKCCHEAGGPTDSRSTYFDLEYQTIPDTRLLLTGFRAASPMASVD